MVHPQKDGQWWALAPYALALSYLAVGVIIGLFLCKH